MLNWRGALLLQSVSHSPPRTVRGPPLRRRGSSSLRRFLCGSFRVVRLFHACACEAVGLVQGCVQQPSSSHGRGFRRAVSGPLVCVPRNTPQGIMPRRLVSSASISASRDRAPWSSSRPENWADEAVDSLHCCLHALALACVCASCRDMRGLVWVLHLSLVRLVRGQWAPLDSSPRCAAALIDLPT